MKVYLSRVHKDPAPPTPEPGALPKGDETVLLLEDKPEVRHVAARILRQQGYTVLKAGDGEEALELHESHGEPIDLPLTDVVLPKIGGQELAERVRAVRPEIKVLFASGYTEDVILQRQVLHRDVRLLQKPFTLESLTGKVREVLDVLASGQSVR